MGRQAWRLAACVLALGLGLYGLWSLGVLNALAARLEPVPAAEPTPGPEIAPAPEPVSAAAPEQPASPAQKF